MPGAKKARNLCCADLPSQEGGAESGVLAKQCRSAPWGPGGWQTNMTNMKLKVIPTKKTWKPQKIGVLCSCFSLSRNIFRFYVSFRCVCKKLDGKME